MATACPGIRRPRIAWEGYEANGWNRPDQGTAICSSSRQIGAPTARSWKAVYEDRQVVETIRRKGLLTIKADTTSFDSLPPGTSSRSMVRPATSRDHRPDVRQPERVLRGIFDKSRLLELLKDLPTWRSKTNEQEGRIQVDLKEAAERIKRIMPILHKAYPDARSPWSSSIPGAPDRHDPVGPMPDARSQGDAHPVQEVPIRQGLGRGGPRTDRTGHPETGFYHNKAANIQGLVAGSWRHSTARSRQYG